MSLCVCVHVCLCVCVFVCVCVCTSVICMHGLVFCVYACDHVCCLCVCGCVLFCVICIGCCCTAVFFAKQGSIDFIDQILDH